MSFDAPSPRQLDLLRFISAFQARNTWMPSIHEMGEGLGIKSTNAVNDLLKALERKGLLERGRMIARGLRILPLGLSYLGQGRAA